MPTLRTTHQITDTLNVEIHQNWSGHYRAVFQGHTFPLGSDKDKVDNFILNLMVVYEDLAMRKKTIDEMVSKKLVKHTLKDIHKMIADKKYNDFSKRYQQLSGKQITGQDLARCRWLHRQTKEGKKTA